MEYYSIESTFSLRDSFKYYSQISGKYDKQIDKLVLDKYINYWKDSSMKNVDGIFIEVGAFDGITYSNTKTMEDSLHWNGILIEPSPSSFEKILRNRPNAIKVPCAISTSSDDFIEFVGDNCAVGGLIHILEKCVNSHTNKEWISAWNLNNIPIDVQTEKLSNILQNNKIKYIDFLSIDVNGSELEVLETMDWSIPIYIIVLDVSTWGNFGKTMTTKCREILSSKGFIMDEKLDMDEIWINNNYFRKKLLRKN